MRQPENGRSPEGAEALPMGTAPVRLPERAAWPAAVLTILGFSLLLWIALAAAFGLLFGWR